MSTEGNFIQRAWAVQFPLVDLRLNGLAGFALALAVAKLWEPVLALDWHWYALIAVLAAIKPLITFFRSVRAEPQAAR